MPRRHPGRDGQVELAHPAPLPPAPQQLPDRRLALVPFRSSPHAPHATGRRGSVAITPRVIGAGTRALSGPAGYPGLAWDEISLSRAVYLNIYDHQGEPQAQIRQRAAVRFPT
ncbi:hypothetical protein GCM10023259_028050 [Thermocatellispora tengchongensis]